ncbi:MAG: hypothetical protein WD229_09225 [Pirellulales bacterium]
MTGTRCLLLVICIWPFVAVPAHAQPLVGSTTSLEAKVALSDVVVVGKITEFKRRAGEATIAVEQTLKGKPQDRLTVQVSGSEPPLDHWKIQGSRLMLFVRERIVYVESILDLSDGELEIMTADFAVLRKAEEAIRVAKEAGGRRTATKTSELFNLSVPGEAWAGTAWRHRCTHLSLAVPVDDRLERRAIEYLGSKIYSQRQEGVQALAHFKSDANVARLKAMLADEGYAYLQHAENNAGIEVRHYGIRASAYEALAAWGVTVPMPVIREAVVNPNIDHVSVAELSDETLRRLQKFPHLRRIHCHGKIDDAGLRRLAGLKHIEQLEITRHDNREVTDAGVKELKALTKLTMLHVPCPNLTDEGLQELAPLTNLTWLDVTYSKINGTGFKALAGLTKLTHLSLHNTPLNDAGLKHLAPFTKLQTLVLSGTRITDAGLKELAPLKNLTTLHLSGAKVTDAGLRDLAPLRKLTTIEIWSNSVSDTTLGVLREIDLLHALPLAKGKGDDRPTSADEVIQMDLGPPFGTKVTDAGLAELVGLKNLAKLDLPAGVTDVGLKELAKLDNLTSLHQGEATLSDEGLRELSRIKKLETLYVHLTDARLRILRELGLLHVLRGATGKADARPKSADEVVSLELRGSHLRDEGFQELAIFKNLAELNLYGSKITDAGLKRVADSLPKLRKLDLRSTGITVAGLDHLEKLSELRELSLAHTKVTEEDVFALRRALPNCRITMK